MSNEEELPSVIQLDGSTLVGAGEAVNRSLRVMNEYYVCVPIERSTESNPIIEYLHKEMTRLYLEKMGKHFLGRDYTVTQEEAEAFIEKMEAEREFDKMMHRFVFEVVQWGALDCFQLVMNTQHLDWIRSYHQRNQKLGIYTGRRKRPGMDRATPTVYGVAILIDESVTEPRLE